MKAKKKKNVNLGTCSAFLFPALPSRQHYRRGEASVMHTNDKWVEKKKIKK